MEDLNYVVILALVVGFFELLMKDVGAVAAAHNEWTEDALSEHFSLGTFVPLSEVKHTAPPGWVSRAHCTLPPRPITGKAETIKLRSSGGGLSERPRPRSTESPLVFFTPRKSACCGRCQYAEGSIPLH